MAICSLFPFARSHTTKDRPYREPWTFTKRCEDLCRISLFRRMRMLPHLYTLAYEACQTGLPVMTPLFFADHTDARLRSVDNAYLLGDVLVYCNVAPYVNENTSSQQEKSNTQSASSTAPHAHIESPAIGWRPMPKGVWRQFWLDEGEKRFSELPELWLKGGSIVCTGEPLEYVGEAKPTDPVTLFVCLDEGGHAEGSLYEDEGKQEKRGNCLVPI